MTERLTKAETRRRVEETDLAELVRRDGITLERHGKLWRGLCPFHSERTPSFTIYPNNSFYCFGCQRAGSALDYVIDRAGGARDYGPDIKRGLATLGIGGDEPFKLAPLPERAVGPAKPDDPGVVEAEYDYRDPAGALVYQVQRRRKLDGSKTFRQRRPILGGWAWNLQGTAPLLYQLPILLASADDDPVFVCEGEKDVDRLLALGIIATCNSGGAGHWPHEQSKHLAGRIVVILPDNDPTGERHAQDVAQSVGEYAKRVKILRLPNLPERGDVSDFLDRAGLGGESARSMLWMLARKAPQQRRRGRKAFVLFNTTPTGRADIGA